MLFGKKWFRKRRRLEEYNESQTVNTLTNMIGRGRISISGAAGLARSIVADHEIPHEALKAFSTLGAEGAHDGNCERDLHRWLRNLWNFNLEPYTIRVNLDVTCTLWCFFLIGYPSYLQAYPNKPCFHLFVLALRLVPNVCNPHLSGSCCHTKCCTVYMGQGAGSYSTVWCWGI